VIPVCLALVVVSPTARAHAQPEVSRSPVSLDVEVLQGLPSDPSTTITLRNTSAEPLQTIIVNVRWFNDTTGTVAATEERTVAELTPQRTAAVELAATPGAYAQRVVRVGVYGRETLITMRVPPPKDPPVGIDLRAMLAASSPPAAVKKVAATYPPVTAALGHQGRVPLAVSIGSSGAVNDIVILSTASSLLFLEEAAVNAVRQWEFTTPPAQLQPFRWTTMVSLDFTLPK
jgi:TonB family protein